MDLPSTLVEALERVADREDAGNSHLDLDAREPVDVSYAELHRRARRFAAALQEAGLARGSRLGLVLPDSADFVTAFYGSLVAGVVPVPVYPPIQLAAFDAYLETTSHVFARAGCPLVLTDARVRPILGRLLETIPGLRSIETFEKLVSRVSEDAAPAPVDVRPGDLAFLQFTSGSTARPKGVALTHENLLANIRAIGGPTGLRITRESSAVSWLPLYHDMGLIGFVLTPLVYETRGVLFVAPLAFLKRPAIWLRQLSSRRASITFAPNFAYGLCTKRIQPRDLEGLDLSSLVVAGCGAEPIQHETLQAFADRFAPVGFRRSAFLPCYGLAEHSLAATMTRLEDDLAFEDLDPAALAEGRAEPAAPGAIASVRLVDCGFPPPGHRLRIAGEDGSPCPDRVVGEIHLSGPSVMRGYWEDEEATAGALDREWLRTGDLGYTVDGRLFVCGRIKDLLIVHGRNYHPQDLERHAGEVDGLRKGNVVAFGVLDPAAGTERVVVAAEGRGDAADAERIASDVKTRLHERTGLGVDEVLVLPPGSLPKTSSGKLQRNKTRERYLDGTLARKPGSTRWRILRELARSRWSYIKSSIRDLAPASRSRRLDDRT